MNRKMSSTHYEFFENSLGSVVMVKSRLKILYQRLRAAGDVEGMKLVLESLEELAGLKTRLIDREAYERAEFARLFKVEEETTNGR